MYTFNLIVNEQTMANIAPIRVISRVTDHFAYLLNSIEKVGIYGRYNHLKSSRPLKARVSYQIMLWYVCCKDRTFPYLLLCCHEFKSSCFILEFNYLSNN